MCSAGWVGRPPPRTWAPWGGIIAAAGGLGGYFPPLVMGATYDPESNSYFVGLTLLAVFCLAAFLLALVVRHGGRKAEK